MSIESYVRDLRTNKPVLAAVIGNSVGCGYQATGSPGIPALSDSNGQLLAANRSTNVATGSWVTLLRGHLKARNSASDLLNFSGNGWNTNDTRGIKTGVSPIPSPSDTVAKVLALAVKPAVVYLPLQINDEPLDLATFETNTRAIIAALAAGGIPTIMVQENYVSGSSGYLSYVQKAADIATSLGIPCIDTYTPFLPNGDGLMYDAKHPNDKGHMLIYAAHRAWIEGYVVGGVDPFVVARSDVAYKLSSNGALRFKQGSTLRTVDVRVGASGPVHVKNGSTTCNLISQ